MRIFASMNRLKAILKLSLNVIVWMLTLIISIPYLMLYKLKELAERIFIKSK